MVPTEIIAFAIIVILLPLTLLPPSNGLTAFAFDGLNCAELIQDLNGSALLIWQIVIHLLRLRIQDGDRGHLMLKIWMRVRIRMFLLKGDIAVKLGQILAKRIELLVKIFRQLLASDLVRATVNDKSTQILPTLLLIQVCFHFTVKWVIAASDACRQFNFSLDWNDRFAGCSIAQYVKITFILLVLILSVVDSH